eukprot:TRINITY_DN447_c1_g1_i6.p1 TRINITY_DN447_c1_g1~~TRINITY_DN447_c1_g1_i6.p1  ORF type:complete len:715 (+),score=175.02 TRINITY_DN447_c1_g1_i6:41-2146(+)
MGLLGAWRDILRYLERASDTDLEAGRKKTAFILSLIGTGIGLTSLLTVLHLYSHSVYRYLNAAGSLLPSIALMVYVLCTRTAPATVLEVATYGWTFAALIAALLAEQNGTPSLWQSIMIILDLCLVNQLEGRVTKIVIGVTCVCLVAFQALTVAGITLDDSEAHVCDCTDPPCRVPVATRMYSLMQDVVVLLADFYLTRGFAHQVLQEKASMQSTIDTVQQIAQHLSAYDVDSVAEILDEREAELSKDMAGALRTLEMHLRLYRPYLPDALFEELHRSQDIQHPLVAAPGLQAQEATIVFTDIRASTVIWESAPEAMKKAIRVHNEVIRQVIDDCGGYEVKTVGDAFMVAFDLPVAGLNFGLRIHTALLQASWPQGLLQVPVCMPRGKNWCGLTVRVGLNSGPVTTERNEVTRRVDYLGHTVNVAARLEGMCTPGAVAVREELWTVVKDFCDTAVDAPPEMVVLKGVQQALPMVCVWPAALVGRQTDPLDTLRPTSVTSVAIAPIPSDTHTSERLPIGVLRRTHATVGVVELALDHDLETGEHLSSALAIVALHLTRSNGTLTTVLGNKVAVGWNVARSLEAHVESAIRFVHSVGVVDCHVGLATGSVERGDIGSSRQRFVTVVGPAVSVSWTLSEVARHRGRTCLYAWMQTPSDAHTVIPASARHHLMEAGLVLPGVEGVWVYELRRDLTLYPSLSQPVP